MAKQILITATKGGTGKTTFTECLRQILDKTQVIDLDHQKTLTFALEMAGHTMTVEKPQYIIYDTPPYNSENLRALMDEVDHIIIPTKLGYPDMIATKTIYDGLISAKALQKAILVFNEVRKPLTLEEKEIIKCYQNNYPKLRFANMLVSKLENFRKVFRTPLTGQALEQIKSLVDEFLIKSIFKTT